MVGDDRKDKMEITFSEIERGPPVKINNKNVIEVLPLLFTDTKPSEETQLSL